MIDTITTSPRFDNSKCDRIHKGSTVLGVNIICRKNRGHTVEPIMIDWEFVDLDKSLAVEDLRGKECKNHVKIRAVNHEKIALCNDPWTLCGQNKTLYTIDHSRDYSLKHRLEVRETRGNCLHFYDNITSRETVENIGALGIDTYRIFQENTGISKIVLNYKYVSTGKEIKLQCMGER